MKKLFLSLIIITALSVACGASEDGGFEEPAQLDNTSQETEQPLDNTDTNSATEGETTHSDEPATSDETTATEAETTSGDTPSQVEGSDPAAPGTSLIGAPGDAGVAPRDDLDIRTSGQPLDLAIDIINKITADAAAVTGTPQKEVQLLLLEQVDWPNAALGCPQPDMMYAQVITPGARVIVATSTTKLTYHVSHAGHFVRCDMGTSMLPDADNNLPLVMGEPFKLVVGDTVRIHDIEVTFVAVTEDSRCPPTVTCVWEGQVGVQISLSGKGTLLGETILRSVQAPTGTAGAHTLTLVSVEPALTKEKPSLEPTDYLITLTMNPTPTQ